MSQNQNQEQKPKVVTGHGTLAIEEDYIEPLKMVLDFGKVAYYSIVNGQVKYAGIYFINYSIVVRAIVAVHEDGTVLWVKYTHNMLGDRFELVWNNKTRETQAKLGDKEVKTRAEDICAVRGEDRSCIVLPEYVELLYKKAINDLRLY